MELIQNSHILRTSILIGPDERRYAEVEIASCAEFEPGQYLMIRSHVREVRWPYPYCILRKTRQSLVLLADSSQELYNAAAGERIEFWGPCGRCPLHPEEQAMLVAEPATAFLLAPFVHAGICKKYILIGAPSETMLIPDDTVYVSTVEEAAVIVAENPQRKVAALNPEQLAQFAVALSPQIQADTLVFVSNKKACGINACKGCYLHSATERFGINVCCKGPYLPLCSIDFASDGKCFEKFN